MGVTLRYDLEPACEPSSTCSWTIGRVFGDSYVQDLAAEAQKLGHEVTLMHACIICAISGTLWFLPNMAFNAGHAICYC